MSTMKSVNVQNSNGEEETQKENAKMERTWSGIGWGLVLILIGILVFADNHDWLRSGVGWLYFVIGVGVIFIIGFLVRSLRNTANVGSSIGGLILGMSLVYVGAAFLFGFGNWWPIVFILIGFGYLVKAAWQRR